MKSIDYIIFRQNYMYIGKTTFLTSDLFQQQKKMISTQENREDTLINFSQIFSRTLIICVVVNYCILTVSDIWIYKLINHTQKQNYLHIHMINQKLADQTDNKQNEIIAQQIQMLTEKVQQMYLLLSYLSYRLRLSYTISSKHFVLLLVVIILSMVQSLNFLKKVGSKVVSIAKNPTVQGVVKAGFNVLTG